MKIYELTIFITDLLINQWDKENYNPDNTTNHEEEELIPEIQDMSCSFSPDSHGDPRRL
jgi:hypothetical protein